MGHFRKLIDAIQKPPGDYKFGSPKFSNLESHGIVAITYKSIETFHIAFRQIISSISRDGTAVLTNQLFKDIDSRATKSTDYDLIFEKIYIEESDIEWLENELKQAGKECLLSIEIWNG
ncbi:15876_t:CDS:2 [Funneliformis geosporum]|nr:15876_t:CDS:2 [Funneliformis geosporum]